MTESVDIRDVRSASDRRRFLDLPFRLYRSDPNWVPPFRGSQAKLFARKGAFFDHADMALFLAVRDGRDVGRIAAIQNHAHNDHYGDKLGFFGFFESEDDPAAAGALFDAARKWLKDRGLDSLRGPVNPSMNNECGLLIDGFERPPVALMPYNARFVPALVEGAGLSKCKDMYAYLIERKHVEPGGKTHTRLLKMRELLRRRHPELEVRTIDMKNYQDDLVRFTGVFEEARRNNWGYVPVTKEEMFEMARELKPVADPDIVIFAEVDGEPAGASLALPDINHLLKATGGRLFPFGWWKFLTMRRHLPGIRIFGIAALEKFRHIGITGALFVETLLRGSPKQYQYCEASWVLEDNVMSNRTIEKVVKPERYKTYRIYEQTL